MPTPESSPRPVPRRRYVRAVSPGLRKLLVVVLALTALQSINGFYLVSVTFAEWVSGAVLQNYFYQLSFLIHLLLGVVMTLPFLVFGAVHLRNTWNRPNRPAVRVGLGLFVVALLLLASGYALMRIEGLVDLRGTGRDVLYWVHVLSPLAVAWLFILHRLAGPRIRWKTGRRFAYVALVFAALMLVLHSQDPKNWNVAGPAEGEKYFFPSPARTASGGFIPARSLMMDAYCRECHADVHERWEQSAHRLSSFNNPAYLFSIRETREALLAREGNFQASRLCAGCHDPVVFFSGAFDDPNFDDVNHPTAHAGITCTSCHAITNVNSTKGNGDFTIEEPSHYPFAFSENALLQWVNRQLIRAKPAFHKKTFLKPLHSSPEFCGTCHKVHLPEELNDYRWLRAQNHYDSHRLSGVSGHNPASFYYPPEAITDCNTCHMEPMPSDDLGAKVLEPGGSLAVHDHLFPSANTAIPHLKDAPAWVYEAHQAFNEGAVRVDLFGVRDGGSIDAKLTAPLGPEVPTLVPGRTYLLEVVIRTLTLGHPLTQGTSDSNELWLDVAAREGDRTLGRSGGRDGEGRVDPWSHFVNAYVLDREGRRIERRNPQDIFVPLYDHQIPPGAADVVHYRLTVPADATGPIEVAVRLRYRKFDTTFMKHVMGSEYRNDLPVLEMAEDRVVFPISGTTSRTPVSERATPTLWERWNDYGIGLFRKGHAGSRKGELRQAEVAFREVEALGHADGPLNLARVYLKEGRLDDAVAALERAARFEPPAPPWTVAWLSALVDQQNGEFDAAIERLLTLAETRYEEARERGFDFSKFDGVPLELARTYYLKALQQRGPGGEARREQGLRESATWYRRALALDSELAEAHYGLSQVFVRLQDETLAEQHRRLHAFYKRDDNAAERATAKHRASNPAADHAAEVIVIYDLQREGAFELDQ